jgi:transcriptional regulator with XRE-family HTH domain
MLKIKESGPPPYAERIRSAISFRGRSRSDVAKAIGMSINGLTRITRGETKSPEADIIRALALELNVSGEYLLGLSDVIEPRQSNGREPGKE